MRETAKKMLRGLTGASIHRNGELRLSGIEELVNIRRDKHGIPVIEARNDADAWFGLGFCHGQDRAAQLDFYRRAALGKASELVGEKGLAIDRVSRRIGFARAAVKQLEVLAEDAIRTLNAYANGVTAGMHKGLKRRPLEARLLGAGLEEWEAKDVLAFLKLLSFLLPSNWDVELARYKIASADGAEAVLALDPAVSARGPFVNDTLTLVDGEGQSADNSAKVADRLAQDLSEFFKVVPAAGGSNNWVISGKKTANGNAILANDPHLNPMLPAPWYLAQIRTPEWSVCGSTIPGAPCFASGHNGFAAWGATAALHDNTDFFLESLGPDGKSVWAGGKLVECEVIEERIKVKGGKDVIERVLLTPRGPLVAGAFDEIAGALSIKSVWLEPLPIRGLLDVHKVKSFSQFRTAFKEWPLAGQYMVYADAKGNIGWQLVGQIPRREKSWGMLPLDACKGKHCWESLVPFEEMPWGENPVQGFFATANNPPQKDGAGPYLGYDWVSGYRASVISEAISNENDWSVGLCMKLQCAVQSKPWEEVRDIVLQIVPQTAHARGALQLLEHWDGNLDSDSAAASIYVYFFCEVAARTAKAKAPLSWEWSLGKGFCNLMPFSLFADRQFEHVVHILKTQPAGWFKRGWAEELSEALDAALQRLEKESGKKVKNAVWGKVRPIILKHLIFGEIPLFKKLFNAPPIPGRGDSNTVFQCTVNPLDPRAAPTNIPNLRLVIDVGNWSDSRYVVCGGQSGDPLSPHYTDLFKLWQKGEGVRMPWTEEEVHKETKALLKLIPKRKRPVLSLSKESCKGS